VKVFDVVAARTGLREHEAQTAARGWAPATTPSSPDDHKAYYPGATPISVRVTADTRTGRLLGAQLVGRRSAEIAKRIDAYATALFHSMSVDEISDLDLSYTPPLGSPGTRSRWPPRRGPASTGSRQACLVESARRGTGFVRQVYGRDAEPLRSIGPGRVAGLRRSVA
jgi:hypothetical protein